MKYNTFFFRNVFVYTVNGILFVKTLDKSFHENHDYDHFADISLTKTENGYMCAGNVILYEKVKFVSFDYDKFAPYEVNSFCGIKFVLRGNRQLFHLTRKEFVHFGPINI